MSQLDVILFTHFHVDHSADFPTLIFSSWFEERDRPLPVYGPAGNSEFPSKHMPPSVIGQIAQQAHVKRLVLSHRMLRTLGKESQSLSEIRKNFSGPVAFANDLDCFRVP